MIKMISKYKVFQPIFQYPDMCSVKIKTIDLIMLIMKYRQGMQCTVLNIFHTNMRHDIMGYQSTMHNCASSKRVLVLARM